MSDTFYKDLESGKKIEKAVLSIIKKKYPKSYIIDGYFKDYDIYVPEKDIGVEVKRDEKSKYTGNIVVEIEFDGKPSALSTTKADWWAQVLTTDSDIEGILMFPVEKLKKIVKKSIFKGKGRMVMGGDDKTSEIALVPLEDLTNGI